MHPIEIKVLIVFDLLRLYNIIFLNRLNRKISVLNIFFSLYMYTPSLLFGEVSFLCLYPLKDGKFLQSGHWVGI